MSRNKEDWVECLALARQANEKMQKDIDTMMVMLTKMGLVIQNGMLGHIEQVHADMLEAGLLETEVDPEAN